MTRTTADRQRAYRVGRLGETMAVLMLRLKGYQVLARNWRTPAGEADIVARRGKALAFVEVKARPTKAQALEAVSVRQQQRIRRAAEGFLATHTDCANMHVRFDLMAIVPFRLPAHIRAAWGYDDAPNRRI